MTASRERANPAEPVLLVPFTDFEAASCTCGRVPFVGPVLLLAEYVFCTAPLVVRLSDGGCNSRGMWFVRPDFLTPSCVNEEGPSASIFFQGGDSGFFRGFGAVSLTRRLLLGGSSWPSICSTAWPFVFGVFGKSSSFGGMSIPYGYQLSHHHHRS